MKKESEKDTGAHSLIRSMKSRGVEVNLKNYLSFAGIPLPIDREKAAELIGHFPEWEEEIEELTEGEETLT